jgi:hypothetical protein
MSDERDQVAAGCFKMLAKCRMAAEGGTVNHANYASTFSKLE